MKRHRDLPNPLCVTTRLRLKGPWALVRFLFAYRRVRQTLGGAPGLIHASLLWEKPFTVCIFSVWRSEAQMSGWVGVPAHVDAVRQTYKRITHETWSGLWRLEFVSPSARRWSEAPAMETVLPVRDVKVPDWGRREGKQ